MAAQLQQELHPLAWLAGLPPTASVTHGEGFRAPFGALSHRPALNGAHGELDKTRVACLAVLSDHPSYSSGDTHCLIPRFRGEGGLR